MEEELWNKINYEQYKYEFTYDKCLPFSTSEFNSINKIYYDRYNISTNGDKKCIDLSTKNGKIVYTLLFKFTDEWYIIGSTDRNYYKCDQWDGLLDCLNNIL